MKLSAGEFIQYLVTSPCTGLKFSLREGKTGEIILSDNLVATYGDPATFTRLWPIVGDRPQQESFLELTIEFAEARDHCTFQVQHRRADGTWKPSIDLDFEALEGGDSCQYSFTVLAD